MENKVKSIIIGYWYKELEYNPISKIGELENSLNKVLNVPFLVNNHPLGSNIIMPRIQALSSDKSILFNLSLINASITININSGELDYDNVILLANEKTQLFFDILNDIYDVDILYTSIKVEMVTIDQNANERLIEYLHLKNDDYEDITFKKGIKKDNAYYINYMISSNKEINFNIELKNNTNHRQEDIIDRAMLVSLSEASIINNFLLVVIEINDRLAYNNDSNYLTTKENIRGMISELKMNLKKSIESII